VSDKRFAVNYENVRLDTRESTIERIEQRALVPIIIVRVGIRERFGSVNRANANSGDR